MNRSCFCINDFRKVWAALSIAAMATLFLTGQSATAQVPVRIQLDNGRLRVEPPRPNFEPSPITPGDAGAEKLGTSQSFVEEEKESANASKSLQDQRESVRRQDRASISRISTDTRSLRTNIHKLTDESPQDLSPELVAQANLEDTFAPSEKRFAWAAPDIRYQPLYFEDVVLERYGQTPCGCRQTALSAAHFFKSATFLPYLMLQNHPCSCDWPLGFCRPGSAKSFVWQKDIVH